MRYNEMKVLGPEERSERLVAEVEQLRKLRFAHAISPLQNPMQIRQRRRLIARLHTAQSATKK